MLPPEVIAAFWRDGAIRVREFYSPEWVAHIAALIDDIVARPSPLTGERDPEARFHGEYNSWLTVDAMRDLVLLGPGASLAQQLFGSARVNFFYDQIFVNEPLSPDPTPWHRDSDYWPIEGEQMLSIWTSVDPADRDSSVLEFAAGSHRRPDREAGEPRTPLSWPVEPGDALVFHGRMLHGARGNNSATHRRRALVTRWCGDDITYRAGRVQEFYSHDMQDGDSFTAPVFPQILPQIITSQIALRMAGPILPDPATIAATRPG